MNSHYRIALACVLTGLLCGAAAAPAGAVTAELSGSTLVVNGGDASERIVVGLRTGVDGSQSYSVAAFGARGGPSTEVVPGAGCRPSVFGENNDDSGLAICAAPPVQAVSVAGLGGDDELEIVHVQAVLPRYQKIVVPVRLEGGAGSDELDPDTGPTVANGGAGNDQIYRRCGPGAATLTGGTGNDAISACSPDTGDGGGGPVKVIAGGPGVDNLDGSAGRDRITGGAGSTRSAGTRGPTAWTAVPATIS